MRRADDDRKQEIIEAATSSIATEGIEGTTIRTVAERANVSTGLVMYHFKSKEELLAAAWESALIHFAARVSEMSPSSGLDWMESLYRVCFIDRDEATAPWNLWLEYWAKGARTEELRQFHSRRFANMRQGAAAHARAGLSSGEIRSDLDPELIGDLFFTLIYGLAVQVTLDRESIDPQRAFQIAQFALGLLKTATGAVSEPADHEKPRTKRTKANRDVLVSQSRAQ